MSQFGLLDKVMGITSGNTAPTPTATIKKSLKNVNTLAYGDEIRDEEGTVRYVIAVDNKRKIVFLTGENRDISDYQRVYAWTQDKINEAVKDNGFELN